jgi:hypothetical protein
MKTNQIAIREIRSTKNEDVFNVSFITNASNNSGLSRRLKGVFNSSKLLAFTSLSPEFITELSEEISSNTGETIDLMDYVDQGVMSEEINSDSILLPESYEAKIVVLEFTEGETIPEEYQDDIFLDSQNKTDDNTFKVASWETSEGEIKTQQPKLITDKTTGETTYFKHKGKLIYRNTAIWFKGDTLNEPQDKKLDYDKSENSEIAKNATSKLRNNLRKAMIDNNQE